MLGREYLTTLAGFSVEAPHRIGQICAALIRREERDYDLTRTTGLATKPLLYLHEREIIAEVCAEFRERELRRVFALAAICAVVVRLRMQSRAWHIRSCTTNISACRLWESIGYLIQCCREDRTG